jgi:uracil-DNA glycosylase
MSARAQAVHRVIAHLEMLKECGEKEIDVNLTALKGLKQALHVPPETQPGMKTLASIARRIAACQKCGLCATRTNTVPGQGNPHPELMFVGEGPGADEDEQGLAFVGRAGQLLTKIIEAMGLTRDEVFIGNIVKCRPPGNRVPEPEEMEACIPYLKEQIALLKPKVIVCLGATAVKGFFGVEPVGITKIRGNWRTFEGIDVMPTYHPAYLLRNPNMKKDVWTDMKEVLRRLGKPVPK